MRENKASTKTNKLFAEGEIKLTPYYENRHKNVILTKFLLILGWFVKPSALKISDKHLNWVIIQIFCISYQFYDEM